MSPACSRVEYASVTTLMLAFMVCAVFGTTPAIAQDAARPLDRAADDEKRADLAARGRCIEGTQVVVWTPAAVTETEHRELVARLDRGAYRN